MLLSRFQANQKSSQSVIIQVAYEMIWGLIPYWKVHNRPKCCCLATILSASFGVIGLAEMGSSSADLVSVENPMCIQQNKTSAYLLIASVSSDTPSPTAPKSLTSDKVSFHERSGNGWLAGVTKTCERSATARFVAQYSAQYCVPYFQADVCPEKSFNLLLKNW